MEVNQKEQVFIERSRGLNIMNGAGKLLNRLGFNIYKLDAGPSYKRLRKMLIMLVKYPSELLLV